MSFSRKRIRAAIPGAVSGSAIGEEQVSAVGFAGRGYLNMTILRDDWKSGAVIR